LNAGSSPWGVASEQTARENKASVGHRGLPVKLGRDPIVAPDSDEAAHRSALHFANFLLLSAPEVCSGRQGQSFRALPGHVGRRFYQAQIVGFVASHFGTIPRLAVLVEASAAQQQ
jgi:hypothetical protein